MEIDEDGSDKDSLKKDDENASKAVTVALTHPNSPGKARLYDIEGLRSVNLLLEDPNAPKRFRASSGERILNVRVALYEGEYSHDEMIQISSLLARKAASATRPIDVLLLRDVKNARTAENDEKTDKEDREHVSVTARDARTVIDRFSAVRCLHISELTSFSSGFKSCVDKVDPICLFMDVENTELQIELLGDTSPRMDIFDCSLSNLAQLDVAVMNAPDLLLLGKALSSRMSKLSRLSVRAVEIKEVRGTASSPYYPVGDFILDSLSAPESGPLLKNLDHLTLVIDRCSPKSESSFFSNMTKNAPLKLSHFQYHCECQTTSGGNSMNQTPRLDRFTDALNAMPVLAHLSLSCPVLSGAFSNWLRRGPTGLSFELACVRCPSENVLDAFFGWNSLHLLSAVDLRGLKMAEHVTARLISSVTRVGSFLSNLNLRKVCRTDEKLSASVWNDLEKPVNPRRYVRIYWGLLSQDWARHFARLMELNPFVLHDFWRRESPHVFEGLGLVHKYRSRIDAISARIKAHEAAWFSCSLIIASLRAMAYSSQAHAILPLVPIINTVAYEFGREMLMSNKQLSAFMCTKYCFRAAMSPADKKLPAGSASQSSGKRRRKK
jgi:hypothetical protein